MWQCSSCTYLNHESLNVCEMCEQPLTIVLDWTCRQCTLRNESKLTQCTACSYKNDTSSSFMDLSETITDEIDRKRKRDDIAVPPISSTKSSTSLIFAPDFIPLLKACLLQPQSIAAYYKSTREENYAFKLSSDTSFISQRDNGHDARSFKWGCGYRNIQMLHSSLLQSTAFNSSRTPALYSMNITTISALQEAIEDAWRNGFDVAGAEDQHWELQGTNKWIGAVECLTLLRFMGIPARVVDFDSTKTARPIKEVLCEWTVRYFDAFDDEAFIPPLFLQFQGHSITIVGYEKRRDKASLLVFDPNNESALLRRSLEARSDWQKLFMRGEHTFGKDKYQVVYVIAASAAFTYDSLSKMVVGEDPANTDFSIFAT